MRRAANLIEQIVTYDNLKLAFLKAARGKRSLSAVQEFAVNLDRRITEMSRQLQADQFPLGRFHQFVIRDPKERVITAPCFDERVLHHAIMNVCEPVFDCWLIDDTFACRLGRGREAAVARAEGFAHQYGWFLKCDIRKYFDSISHIQLHCLLQRRLKDQRLLHLLDRIIGSFRGAIGSGLPIGSLTSQHLANFYLGWFDRFVKETLRVRGYVRYMDDMILWDNDSASLKTIEVRCGEFLGEVLSLELKPVTLQRTSTGVNFLGCRIWPTHVGLSRRSKRRWRRRVRDLERAARLGLIGERAVQIRAEAATAFARSADVKSWRFRQAALQHESVNGH
jgi:hypothetical protein